MTAPSPYDDLLARLNGSGTATVAPPVATAANPPPPQVDDSFVKWMNVLLVAAMIGLFVYVMRGEGNGPRPNPNVDGKCVLITENVESRLSLTPDQQAIMTSSSIRELCTSLGVELRKYDLSEDLKNVDQKWAVLRDLSKQTPGAVVSGGRSGTVWLPMPTSEEGFKSFIEGEFR